MCRTGRTIEQKQVGSDGQALGEWAVGTGWEQSFSWRDESDLTITSDDCIILWKHSELLNCTPKKDELYVVWKLSQQGSFNKSCLWDCGIRKSFCGVSTQNSVKEFNFHK